MELSEVNVSSILNVQTLQQNLKRNHVENDTALHPPSTTLFLLTLSAYWFT